MKKSFDPKSANTFGRRYNKLSKLSPIRYKLVVCLCAPRGTPSWSPTYVKQKRDWKDICIVRDFARDFGEANKRFATFKDPDRTINMRQIAFKWAQKKLTWVRVKRTNDHHHHHYQEVSLFSRASCQSCFKRHWDHISSYFFGFV